MQNNQRTPFIDTYIRLLQVASEVELLPGRDSFGTDERALFDAIMLAWAQNTPLTVLQAIGIEALGSPSTLHKRLSRLRSMELIKAVGVDGNRRTKYLAPSENGLKYADAFGKVLLQHFKFDC